MIVDLGGYYMVAGVKDSVSFRRWSVVLDWEEEDMSAVITVAFNVNADALVTVTVMVVAAFISGLIFPNRFSLSVHIKRYL